MFSQRIVGAGKFLMMPISTRLLYYELGMRADDDGVVEAYPVLQGTGLSEDDLRLLVAKGYVRVLNEDLVTYILDWNEHNLIRADRKVSSIYKELLVQVIPSIEIKEPRRRADLKPLKSGQPMDVHWTPQDRLGKVSIGKNKSINTLSLFLSDKEEILKHTKELYPDKNVTLAMEDFIAYCESKYTKYKDFKKAFQNWVREDRYGKYAMAISEQKVEKTEEELDLILYGRK